MGLSNEAIIGIIGIFAPEAFKFVRRWFRNRHGRNGRPNYAQHDAYDEEIHAGAVLYPMPPPPSSSHRPEHRLTVASPTTSPSPSASPSIRLPSPSRS